MIRGETYTFTVEGGNDPSDPSNYHPLYITDSISGGRLQNTPQQQAVGRGEGGREGPQQQAVGSGEGGREGGLLACLLACLLASEYTTAAEFDQQDLLSLEALKHPSCTCDTHSLYWSTFSIFTRCQCGRHNGEQ